MDRLQLKQYLHAAGVPEDRYLLVGVDPPRAVKEGACIVRPNQRSWEVLVYQPVRLQPSLTFLNEDEACEYVLDVLTADLAGAMASPEAGPAVSPEPAGAEKGAIATLPVEATAPAVGAKSPGSGKKKGHVAELVP